MKSAAFLRETFLLCTLFLTIVGCGGQAGDQPDLGSVTGTVTLDEKPLAGVVVVFSPEKGRSSVGTTDSDGKYELIYVGDTKGANIGTHKISITTALGETADEGAAPVKETIPAKYNTQTTLTEEVKAGDNVIDLKLTSN
mgnify:CR=1 FL=1|tara:strand:- start:911 stop:1330 length:420 start_codon:yes stop_codon:yes gene_type:complete